MNAIYCNNLSDYERQMTFLEKSFEADFQEAMLALEMVENRAEINCLKAEARVLLESGTEDDLLYLYTEANNEAGQKKEGIITNVLNRIKKFMSDTWNSFVGLFSKQNKEQLKENANKSNIVFEYTVNGLNKAIDEVGSALDSGWGKIVGLLAVVATTGGVGAYLKKKSDNKQLKLTADNVEETVKGIETAHKKAVTLVDKARALSEANKPDANNEKKDENGLVKFVKGIGDAIKSCLDKLKSLFNVKDKGENKPAEPAAIEQKPEPKKPEPGSAMSKAQSRIEKAMADRAQRQAMGLESAEDDDPLDELDSAMMESASLEELEALINNL